MATLDEFMVELKSALVAYAKTALTDLKNDAVKDVGEFLSSTKDDLARWTEQFKRGDISEEDLRDNVRTKASVAKLTALKKQGLTKIRRDKFVNGLANVVVSTAAKMFKP